MSQYMKLIGQKARKASLEKINTKRKNKILKRYASLLDIEKNSIQFFMPLADNYRNLYSIYCNYLTKNFTNEQLLSIYYHEAIHWLRLLPYRINKDEKMAVVFYVGLLEVLRDLKRMSNE